MLGQRNVWQLHEAIIANVNVVRGQVIKILKIDVDPMPTLCDSFSSLSCLLIFYIFTDGNILFQHKKTFEFLHLIQIV